MSSPVANNEHDLNEEQSVEELLSQIALINLTEDETNEIPHLSMFGGDSNLYENDSYRTESLPLSTGLNACGVFHCPGTTHTPSRKPVERSHSLVTSKQMMSPYPESLDQSWPNFDSSWLPMTNLNGSHRSLGRTSSDPMTIDDASFHLTPASQVMEAGTQGTACRYKTELCRPFEEHGVCKYGDKCQFAHGRHELRVVSRHPKYKTDLCKTYHSTGLCPYGARCHFIHEVDEEAGVYRECQKLLREERLRVLKEQELILQAQRQQRQQELLITALLQASRQRHLSQLSTSVTSPNKYSTNVPSFTSQSPSPRSPLCSFQTVCDSLDSTTSSSSSSVSESPASSPSFSMFSSDELNNVQATGESLFKPASSSCSKFSLPELKKASLLQQLASTDSNVIVPPHIDLFSETKDVRPCAYSQKELIFGVNATSNLDSESSYLTDSFLSSLSQLPEDTTIKDILLVAEVFRAVKASQKAASNSQHCHPGQSFKDTFYNIEQFSA